MQREAKAQIEEKHAKMTGEKVPIHSGGIINNEHNITLSKRDTLPDYLKATNSTALPFR